MRPFKEIAAKGLLDRVQVNVRLFADQLINIPLLDGVLLEDVALSTSETQVKHKLGRAYRGWIIVDKNAQQDVWVSSTALNKTFLSLTAAGTVTVSIWVF
jgi:hypothetical protein